MADYRITRIDVQVSGNDIIIEVNGFYVDSRYTLADIDFMKLSGGIELKILSHINESIAADTELSPFRKTISLTDLKPNVYYIRIDNNNNWTKWFKITDQPVQAVEVNQFQQHKQY